MNLYESIVKEADDNKVIKEAKWGDLPITVEFFGGDHPYRLCIYTSENKNYLKDTYWYDSEEEALKELDRLASLDVKKFTNEDKKQFAEAIDTTGLTNKIKEFTGINNIEIKYDIKPDKYNDSYYLAFESNDIKDSCGVFGKVMKYCVVDNFSSSITTNRDKTALRAWCSVHLSYQHKDGGMNGVELFTAFWDGSNWEFKE